MTMSNIAVFASGNGSNAENIIRYFNKSEKDSARVVLVVSNNKDAYVVTRAQNLDVPVEIITKKQLNDRNFFLALMSRYDIDFIVLAGFLLMIPPFLIEAFHDCIVNIHPSLLPKYGGKGMYGHHIHEAVVAAHEKETGITIHSVNEACDEGSIIFQTSVPVDPDDTPSDVERKIHELEKVYYPQVIGWLTEKCARADSIVL